MLCRSRGSHLRWHERHLIQSLHNGTYYAKYAAMMILFEDVGEHNNRIGTVICRDARRVWQKCVKNKHVQLFENDTSVQNCTIFEARSHSFKKKKRKG